MSKNHCESRCKTYMSCFQHAAMDVDQVRAEENKKLIQYKLRRICPACEHVVVPPDNGGFLQCRCGYRDGLVGNYVLTWFERSPIRRKWWQFWKPSLIDGMTWGPWVRSARKFKVPDPPPPPPPPPPPTREIQTEGDDHAT